MAVYYDQFYANSRLNGSQDPTQELYTFLSYKLNDWCTKIGSNYAVMIDDHTNLFSKASTYYDNSDDQCYLSIQLKGPGSRAGLVNNTTEAQGVYFWMQSSWSYLYQWKGLPATLNTGTYGQTSFTSTLQLTYTSSYTNSSHYSNPRLTRVMYSDTPGNRFFAWYLNDRDAGPLNVLIMEVQKRPDVPDEDDLGWVVVYDSVHYYNAITLPWYNDAADTYPYKNANNNNTQLPTSSNALLVNVDGSSYTGVPMFSFGQNIMVGASSSALTRLKTPFGYYSNWANRLWLKEAEL